MELSGYLQKRNSRADYLIMNKNVRLMTFFVLALSQIAKSQTITESFGSGVNQFSIDFVEIGNPGNSADTNGSPSPAGSVSYVYNIGKYEISRGIIEKVNAAGGLGIGM